MKKRFVAILMAAVMGISLIGCGQSGSEITENTGADSRIEESGSTYSEPDEKAGEALGEWLAELMGGASGATQEAKANQDGGTNKGTDLNRKSLTSEALLDAEAAPAGMYYKIRRAAAAFILQFSVFNIHYSLPPAGRP